MGRLGEVGTIPVRDEPEVELPSAVVTQRFISHDRAQVGSTDTDVDDVADRLSRMARSDPTPYLLGETGHPVEDGMHRGNDVLTPDVDICVSGCAQGHVQCSSLFRGVYLLAAEHRVDPGAQINFARELKKECHRLVVDAVLGEVKVKSGGLESV